ncbi:hypothetical protein, partial [Micrococcus luteus]|uniref:hypothetical protein n=1 Tax=Micrococcus luteus TaxID=1270 RepID=UPI001C8EB8D4
APVYRVGRWGQSRVPAAVAALPEHALAGALRDVELVDRGLILLQREHDLPAGTGELCLRRGVRGGIGRA